MIVELRVEKLGFMFRCSVSCSGFRCFRFNLQSLSVQVSVHGFRDQGDIKIGIRDWALLDLLIEVLKLMWRCARLLQKRLSLLFRVRVSGSGFGFRVLGFRFHFFSGNSSMRFWVLGSWFRVQARLGFDCSG